MPEVLFKKKGHTPCITINRPEVLNALSYEVRLGLLDAWKRVNEDPDIFCAIITGAGDKAFSAGADVRGTAKYRTQASRSEDMPLNMEATFGAEVVKIERRDGEYMQNNEIGFNASFIVVIPVMRGERQAPDLGQASQRVPRGRLAISVERQPERKGEPVTHGGGHIPVRAQPLAEFLGICTCPCMDSLSHGPSPSLESLCTHLRKYSERSEAVEQSVF